MANNTKNVEIIKTDSRKILEINEDYAVVEISANDHTDVLKKVPLNLEAALEKFGKENSKDTVYGLAIRHYFTEQANSLRTDGVARENRKKRKMQETVQKMDIEELKASLTKKQLEELGLA